MCARINSSLQVCDLVINAPIQSWLRRVKGDLNYADFQQLKRDIKYAASNGKPLPQWQPPKVPMWKALEHLETLSRTKLASDAFKAAIRNGWTDAGFLSADGGPPPVYNHQNFGTKKRRLKRLRSRFAGEFFSAVDLDVGKKVGVCKIVAPLEMDSRGDLLGAGADDVSRSYCVVVHPAFVVFWWRNDVADRCAVV